MAAAADRIIPGRGLALIEDAFARLLDEPGSHQHVTGFASGDVAFVVTRDGVEVRRRTELYPSQN